MITEFRRRMVSQIDEMYLQRLVAAIPDQGELYTCLGEDALPGMIDEAPTSLTEAEIAG